MAMTRRSWYRVIGFVVVLGIVAAGGAILWAQLPPPPELSKNIQVNWTNPQGPTSSVLPEKTTKPIGTWERKVGPLAVTLRFDNEQMHGTIAIKTKDATVKDAIITFRADYGVTKDSIIYGVVSTIDAKVSGKKKPTVEDLAKMEEGLNTFHDQPFSMRFRQDGNELVLRDLKFTPSGEGQVLDGKKMSIGLGRFTRKAEECTPTIISAKNKETQRP